MRLGNIPIDSALGAILVHNIADADGRRAFSKGRVLSVTDVMALRDLGLQTVYAAILDEDDVREDDAALRLARAVAGKATELSKPSGGRVNVYATEPGFLRVDVNALRRINELNGVTLATIPRWTSVKQKKMIATLKTVGLALPETAIQSAEKIGAVVSVVPVRNVNVAIVLTGSASARERVEATFLPPIHARIQELGARVIAEAYVDENADAIAVTLTGVIGAGAQMIILAGETSIMDADDITPRGIRGAGGAIELYGAPVEPGNLLLLAYKPCEGLEPSQGFIPIIGAPGCVKSRETNVVDLILPPLLAGERLTRADVIEFADGGLLIG